MKEKSSNRAERVGYSRSPIKYALRGDFGSAGTALALFLVLTGNCRNSSLAAPGHFEIRSSIVARSFWLTNQTQGPVARAPQTFVTTCIVGTNDWLIETDAIRNAAEVYYCDGVNTFRTYRDVLLSSDTTKLSPPIPQGAGVTPKPSVLVVPHRHPLGTMAANVTWLAFGSGSVLSKPESRIPLPGTHNARSTSFALGFRHVAEILEGSHGMPKSVKLYVSDAAMKASPGTPGMKRSLKPNETHHLAGVADGTMVCEYSVVEVTNCFGRTFPKKFRLVQLGRIGEENRLRTHFVAEGEVVSIAPSGPPEPILAPGQRVVDARFHSEDRWLDALVYTSKVSKLQPVGDPGLQRLYREELEAAMPLMRKGENGLWMALFLFALIGPPIVYAGYAIYRRRTNGQ